MTTNPFCPGCNAARVLRAGGHSTLHGRMNICKMDEVIFRGERILTAIAVVNGQTPHRPRHQFPRLVHEAGAIWSGNEAFSLPDSGTNSGQRKGMAMLPP